MTTMASAGTAQAIIRLAHMNAGLIQSGDEPGGIQYADGMLRLNSLVNFLQIKGLKLWLIEDLAIPLVVGQQMYSMGPSGNYVIAKPLRVTQAYFLDTSSVQTPLVNLSYSDYKMLSQVNQQGALSSYMIDRQLTTTNVYVWNVPDSVAATGTLHVIARTQTPQMVSLSDNTAFPPEWALTLEWGLANLLTTGQPDSIVSRCQQMADYFREELENSDVEDSSVSFAPDNRSMYFESGFR